jgi:phage terminase small subunit
MALTPKQQRFTEEYLLDLNATQAAIRAGYSPRTANEQAARLLANVSVSEVIRQAMEARSKRTQITADRVIEELRRIAFLDPRGFYNTDGSLKKVSDLTEDQAAALSGIESLEYFEGHGPDRAQVGWTRKIKWWDKIDALKLIAQHLGMLVEKKEITGPNGGPLQHEHSTAPDLLTRLDQLTASFDKPGQG